MVSVGVIFIRYFIFYTLFLYASLLWEALNCIIIFIIIYLGQMGFVVLECEISGHSLSDFFLKLVLSCMYS